MCQEKKEVEDSPAWEIAWMHQYEDSMSSLKIAKKDNTVSSNSIDSIKTNKTIKTRNKKWEENNCIDISSNKLVKSHT